MTRRPCLGTPDHPCPNLAQPGKPRCLTCQRAADRARGTRQQRGYDAAYDRARAELHLELRPPCHWGCGRVATTADHDPPMADVGPHTRLVPACAPCNAGHVAARQHRTGRSVVDTP